MVIDYGDIKKIVNKVIVNRFDHTIMLNQNTPHKQLGERLKSEGHEVIFTDYQPSCENMLLHMVELIQPHLDSSIELVSLRLHEIGRASCRERVEDCEWW